MVLYCSSRASSDSTRSARYDAVRGGMHPATFTSATTKQAVKFPGFATKGRQGMMGRSIGMQFSKSSVTKKGVLPREPRALRAHSPAARMIPCQSMPSLLARDKHEGMQA
eukprot:1786364-Rhodomonas_salina.2